MAGVEAHRTLTAFTETRAPSAGASAGFYTLVPGANLVLFTYDSATAADVAYVKIVTTALSDPPTSGDDANPASATAGDYHYKIVPGDGTVELSSGGRFEIKALSVWFPTADSTNVNIMGMVARTGSG